MNSASRRSLLSFLLHEGGAEQAEYVLILAAVALPMFLAIRLLWGVLVYYFTLESFVIDLPLF